MTVDMSEVDALVAPITDEQPAGPYLPAIAQDLAAARARIDSLLATAQQLERREISTSERATEREWLSANLAAMSAFFLAARPSVVRAQGDIVKAMPQSDRPNDWDALYEDAVKGLAQTKDLSIARELAESALMHRGFEGLATALEATAQLLNRFGDALHPNGGDLDADTDYREEQQALLSVVDDHRDGLAAQAARIPFEGVQVAHQSYAVPIAFAHVKVAESGTEGWPSADQIRKAMQQVPADSIARTAGHVSQCLDALGAFDDAVQRRFAGTRIRVQPSKRLRATLEDIGTFLGRFLPATAGAPVAEAAASSPAQAASTGAPAGEVPLARLLQAQAAIAGASCLRDRFLNSIALAEEALAARLYAVAVPFLSWSIDRVEERKLGGWEGVAVMRRIEAALAQCSAQAIAAGHDITVIGELSAKFENLVSADRPPES
jgi:hypothetical protein